VTHSDFHGNFSFELTDKVQISESGVSEADVDSIGSTSSGTGGMRNNWRECELQASLPGFSSQPIDLSTRLSNFESADIGHLVLQRMGQVQGLSISATSAMAPKDAQKAYAKGIEKSKKEKWDEAESLFVKATEIYPKYAAAWFELGRVQLHKFEAAPARHSFEQSIAADSKYVYPYRGLADLDAKQQQWPALAMVTRQLVALDPVSFPDAWFWNAVSNYYLRNFADAERSARQGMKLDDQHQLPKLEYVLGIILIQEHEYPEAATHLRNYLRVAKVPADIEAAQKQLTQVTRLSAEVSNPVTPEEEKK
jgi:tetratricopeptide (TPR) repeat protein